MKAMVLAAGLGTRLRPLTNSRPKALVEVGGRTLLEIVVTRLRSFGITDVVINVHHFADMMLDYLKKNNNFGLNVEISSEDTLLDTGGGLKKVAEFFCRDSSKREEPFLVHNVDVISTIDLGCMVRLHREKNALATLAVQQRESSRCLLFDEQGQLCGRRTEQKSDFVRAAAQPQALAFSGIHVISPRIFSLMSEDGVFSIITTYLRLAGHGENIAAFRADGYYWRDLGRAEHLAQAAEDLKGVIQAEKSG